MHFLELPGKLLARRQGHLQADGFHVTQFEVAPSCHAGSATQSLSRRATLPRPHCSAEVRLADKEATLKGALHNARQCPACLPTVLHNQARAC